MLKVAEQRAEEAMSMRSEVQKEMEKERKKRLRMTRRLVLQDGIIYDECVDGDADTEPTGQTEYSLALVVVFFFIYFF